MEHVNDINEGEQDFSSIFPLTISFGKTHELIFTENEVINRLKIKLNKMAMWDPKALDDSYGKLSLCVQEFVIPRVRENVIKRIIEEGQDVKIGNLLINQHGIAEKKFFGGYKEPHPWSCYDEMKSDSSFGLVSLFVNIPEKEKSVRLALLNTLVPNALILNSLCAFLKFKLGGKNEY